MAAIARLFTSDGSSTTVMTNHPDLKKLGSYNSALVDKGQWIAYTQAQYNPSTWGPDKSQILAQYQGKDTHMEAFKLLTV